MKQEKKEQLKVMRILLVLTFIIIIIYFSKAPSGKLPPVVLALGVDLK